MNRISALLLSCCIFALCTCSTPFKRKINLVKGLEIASTSRSLAVDDVFLNEMYNKPCRVVAYFKAHKFETHVLRYKEYTSKYPGVSFFFYASECTKEDMLKLMNQHDFHHPVFLDPEKTFPEANKHVTNPVDLAFVGYVVNEVTVEVTHPAQEEKFRKMLVHCEK